MRAPSDRRYLFDALLARGGMATVWRAWDHRLRVWRAIKVLDRAAAPAERARFEREARALARVHHRHVLPIHDVVDEDGHLLLVMDLAWGGSLADRVSRLGALSPHLAVGAVIAVADALIAAHAEGIVHRDVKPANVLLSRDGTPLVADFGIARMGPDAAVTRPGAGFGTPAFAAPEQRRDASTVDGRADVYGAGATLLFLVTGELPWDADRRTADDWQDAGVPAPIARVVERATRAQPDARYPTADALRADLIATLAELPAEPAPVPLVPEDLPTLPPPPYVATTASPATMAFTTGAPPSRTGRARVVAAALGGLAGLAALAGLAVFATDARRASAPPPASEWTVELRPPADGVRARDGARWFVQDRVVHRDPGGPLDGCSADRVVDVSDDRLLLRTDRPVEGGLRRMFRVTDHACRLLQTFRDGVAPDLLDPLGGVFEALPDKIVRLLPDDAAPVVLGTEVALHALAVSPSGQRLAWIRSPDDAATSVVVMDRADGSRRELLRREGLVQTLGIAALAFRDDDHVLYAFGAGWQRTEIALQPADGGAPVTLATVAGAPVEAIEPIPGGVWLDVINADYDIHQSVDGGPPAPLVASPGSDRPAAYLPDGSLVYASNELGSWDGWQVTPEGRRAVIVAGPTEDGRFAVSGDRLVWLRTTDDAIEAWVRAPGEADRLLTRLEGAGPTPPHYPPPSGLELDCSDAGCVLCRARDDRLELTGLDPRTGATTPRGAVVDAKWCAIAADGAVYTTGQTSDRIGVVRGADEATFLRATRQIQSLRPLRDGRWLASGPAPSGPDGTSRDWWVGWWTPDGVAVIARGHAWLGHPRASADGRRVAWLATTEWGAAYELRAP